MTAAIEWSWMPYFEIGYETQFSTGIYCTLDGIIVFDNYGWRHLN